MFAPDVVLPRYRRAFAACLTVVLAACSTTDTKPLSAAATACAGEQAAFEAATGNLSGEAASFEAAAYAVAQRRSSGNPATLARTLVDDAGRLEQSADRVIDEYRAFSACRRAPTAAEAAAANQSLALIQTCQATLRGAADALGAASAVRNGKRLAVSSTVPPPSLPFVAVETATIHARPDAGSARIADLRKGTRATAPGTGGSAGGWTAVQLNDGTIGYVETAALRPVQPNASAVAGTSVPVDPIAALAFTVAQSLPRRIDMLRTAIETGSAAPTALPRE
jgi:hypothetical protein